MSEKYKILTSYKYEIDGSDKEIQISRRNKKGVVGILIVTLGIALLISSFAYLAINDQSGFNPTLLRVMLSLGIILPLIGFVVRGGRNSIKINISSINKSIEIWKKDNKGIHQINLDSKKLPISFIAKTTGDTCYVQIIMDGKEINILELRRTDQKKEIEIVSELVELLNKTIG
ncbi:MAG: hypothetical protein ACJAUD_002623 [Crocinitomicaceae bacterium]|jgi:hypothetical protein